MSEDTRTMSELAREALDVQNACNLSGVVHSFSRAITRLRALLDADGKGGTTAVNGHPICVVWADKIASLANDGAAQLDLERGSFLACYDTVCKLAEWTV